MEGKSVEISYLTAKTSKNYLHILQRNVNIISGNGDSNCCPCPLGERKSPKLIYCNIYNNLPYLIPVNFHITLSYFICKLPLPVALNADDPCGPSYCCGYICVVCPMTDIVCRSNSFTFFGLTNSSSKSY